MKEIDKLLMQAPKAAETGNMKDSMQIIATACAKIGSEAVNAVGVNDMNLPFVSAALRLAADQLDVIGGEGAKEAAKDIYSLITENCVTVTLKREDYDEKTT